MSPHTESNLLTAVGLVLLIAFPIATVVGAVRARSWPERIAILIVVPLIGIWLLWMIVINVSGLNGP